MANQILDPTMIANEMALRFRNSLVFGNSIHREYKKEFTGGQGASVQIRKPTYYSVGTQTKGTAATAQDMSEPYTNITVDQQKYVILKYPSIDKALSIEEFSDRHIAPAAIALANVVDSAISGLYVDVPNAVISGSAGATDSMQGFETIARGGKIMDSFGVPNDKLHAVLGPGGYWDMAVALKDVYNEPINKKILRQNVLGRFGNYDTFMSQNVQARGAGAWTGTQTMTVNGAAQGEVTMSGTTPIGTIAIDGGTAGNIILKGDVVSFAGVYSVNPNTQNSTGLLRQFAVTADATVGTAGNILVTPGVIVGSTADAAYKNVSGTIPDGAVMTLQPGGTADAGVGLQNHLMYHSNAFAMVMVPLPLPEGAAWSRRSTSDGISVRLVKDYNILTDEEIVRVDVLYGVKTINADMAVRILGG